MCLQGLVESGMVVTDQMNEGMSCHLLTPEWQSEQWKAQLSLRILKWLKFCRLDWLVAHSLVGQQTNLDQEGSTVLGHERWGCLQEWHLMERQS